MRRSVFFAFLAFAGLLSLCLAPSYLRAAGGGGGGFGGGGFGGGGRGGVAASATQPAAANGGNATRHTDFLQIARRGNMDLLFVGDSITDFWLSSNPNTAGRAVWDKNFEPLKAANFGISGDTTQGVLWRMQNGELEGFKARLIILMLGTNNITRNPNDQIAEGDRLIIEEFKKHQPQAKVLVLGIFPRGAQATDPMRANVKEINALLAKFADNKQVFYLDIGNKFLTDDGALTAEVMADGLHPTTKGYEIWAAAIMDKVKELMK